MSRRRAHLVHLQFDLLHVVDQLLQVLLGFVGIGSVAVVVVIVAILADPHDRRVFGTSAGWMRDCSVLVCMRMAGLLRVVPSVRGGSGGARRLSVLGAGRTIALVLLDSSRRDRARTRRVAPVTIAVFR